MRKVISLFERDYEGTRLVYDEVVRGAEWVVAGEGVATLKYDGICCAVRGGRLFKRYEVRAGSQRPAPNGFEPAQAPDPVTGDQPGWVPVGTGPEDRWFREALAAWVGAAGARPPDGTYELVGPKVQGNVEGRRTHELIPHGATILKDAPRDFDGLRSYFGEHPLGRVIEGIVWHHPDGRMVKIKGRDFGIRRGEPSPLAAV